MIDFGAATTGIAIYEEGDLQHLAVIPMGGQNVTNDLAIGLRTDPEIAEVVKLAHARFGARLWAKLKRRLKSRHISLTKKKLMRLFRRDMKRSLKQLLKN